MSYLPVEIHITDSQRKSIAAAHSNGSGVSLKFTYKQLEMPENHKILLTPTQHARLTKAYAAKKGLTITLSKKQMQAMKSAGFLPALLVGLASALAPTLFNRIFPQKNDQDGSGMDRSGTANMDGQGIMLPGGHGLVLPHGSGMELPNGAGILLPGARYSTRPSMNTNDRAIQGGNGEGSEYRGGTRFLPDSPMNVGSMAKAGRGMGSKKKAPPMASGFVAPGSETFQDLE